MKKILFICTGNTCRSPMAEALLREKAGGRFRVQSAGLIALNGVAPAKEAVDVLFEKGVRLDHRAQQVHEDHIGWADLILTMTEGQKTALQEQYPDAIAKVDTLKIYADGDWQKLKALYTELETKRAASKQTQLPAADKRRLKQEITVLKQQIESLEEGHPSYNIADPMGGTIEQYRQILAEIEAEIDQLIADNTD